MATYWERRIARADAAMESDERAMAKRVSRAYETEMADLSKEIASYYERYGQDGVLRYRTMLESMDEADRDLLMRDCDAWATAHPEQADMVAIRKSIYKLDRLEGLQASARLHLARATAEATDGLDAHFARQAARGANAVAEAMGFGRAFHTMDDDTIRRFVGTPWSAGESYSERVWGNAGRVAAYVQDDLARALARGESWRRLCDEVSRRFVGASESSVMRLVVTEGTYVSRQAQLAELAREGFEEYRVEPIGDERTCSECSGLSGETFRVADAKPGVSLPPIHPRCRCQIAPAVDDWDAWIDARLDRRRAEIAARRAGGDDAENPLHPVPGMGSVSYGKPLEDLTPHERRGIDDLVRLGYKVNVNEEDGDAPANIDLRLGKDGQLWEMKNVGDGRHSVEGSLRDAYHKWTRLGLDADNESRVVVTSYGATRDEHDVIEEIKRRMKKYAAEAIYIFRDGSSGMFLRR
ncbi:minor capsid protein [Olsenella uli]|uniref:minor capsid protein n=1 Tax=Olsenella uli TaxID=133926 RepID=UPI00044D8B91|nr:minor capsid protein [Olsenella uli]EUB32700.1 protein F-like protein [Olsenella uli MSTE5]